jgi:hypothetical protein
MMEKEHKKPKSIEDYFFHNRFWQLLRSTRKYKDLLWSKEASISFIFALITLILFLLTLFPVKNVFDLKNITKETMLIDNAVNLVRSLSLPIMGGLFGLLGFLVGGLAILSGTMSNKVLANVNSDGKFDTLISVIFNFYFAGAVIGFSIILCVFAHIATYTSIPLSLLTYSIWVIFVSYFVYFSLIYTVMLLGTCIRLFLLSYRYYSEDKKE